MFGLVDDTFMLYRFITLSLQFDAVIGYVSITGEYTPEWKQWWFNPDNVRLYQFMGKDNVYFHTIYFPAMLLADGRDWTTLHHLSTTGSHEIFA
jgi:methionyl-tRNA synthetase